MGGTLGGLLCAWFTAKLLYVFGYRLFKPDRLVLSAQGLRVESLGNSREWAWADITDIFVGRGTSQYWFLTKRLVLSLRDGVPGYTVFKSRADKMHAIWLNDDWATPSHFHSPEYLRDLIEAVRNAKSASAASWRN